MAKKYILTNSDFKDYFEESTKYKLNIYII